MITTTKLIEKLNRNMADAFFDAFNEKDNPRSVIASVEMGDGSTIETELHQDNNLDVYIYHADQNNERQCPNITQYIEENLIDWDELKDAYDDAEPLDEWQTNGFRDEADYWQYRLGS